jgi:hypothetical protein
VGQDGDAGARRLESAAVRSVRRARRPLVALVALLVAIAIGYGIRALNADDSSPAPSQSVTTTGATSTPNR